MCACCGKGRLHDFKLWKESRWRLTPESALFADLGFLGIGKLHARSVLPFKAISKHPLTKEQKRHNKAQAAIRVPVEHVNRQCKIFRIVKDTYRGKHRNYGLNWNLVAAINNLKVACRHLSHATP
ncbi:hypothetical protein MKJ04_09890 [Pontibacter sp. E15-1]|uniref:transposase family protein n=1 Tax=Pontibacter sp. E15-1 TaxID=2919918 RepID=UPI001F4F8908|nr:transposase family protein [Pontibacter sp. E15-1]MCJ8165152.1 hypothetical protein [Pontibacter sp. E15-1]